MPRSIAAVPLDRPRTDRRRAPGSRQAHDTTFTLKDMELLAVFATQAAAAIRRLACSATASGCLRAVMARVADDASEEQVVTSSVPRPRSSTLDAGAPFWQLVDRVAQMRNLSDREQRLVADILEVVATHASRGRRSV